MKDISFIWSHIMASIGAVTLYLVVASLTGSVVYKFLRTSNMSEEDRKFMAIMGGLFFPITIVLGVIYAWIKALTKVTLDADDVCRSSEGEPIQDLIDRVDKLEYVDARSSVTPDQCPKPSKPKFKVGELVTGVSGNPGGYEHLYEGCVCRVIKNDGKLLQTGERQLKVLLIDHEDYDAHKTAIGNTYFVPPRYFVSYKGQVNQIKNKKR